MNRRRHRKSALPTQNLDSFLDILTNTVGVLMFVGLFITLISVQASTTIRTPLVSNTNKRAHFFEVRGNRIIHVDNSALDLDLALLMASLPKCDRPNVPENLNAYLSQYYLDDIAEYEACTNKAIARLKKFQGQTKHYNVRLIDIDAIEYQPATSNVGESIQEIAQANSEFSTILKQLDPQIDYLAFIVRPESFSAFRAARQQAWQEGFDVGWEPQSTKEPIVFSLSGSGGRKVGVQ
jgi:hypothetical protein